MAASSSQGEIVVVEHDDVLHGAVPTLDFALCLGMVNGSPHVVDMVAFEIVSQVVEDETPSRYRTATRDDA
jgi:hypothetical protein